MSERSAEHARTWWVSWYHDPNTDESFEYHGPWWISGYDMNDRSVIVAAVSAPSEEAVWALVQSTYDAPPTNLSRRFCDEIESGGGSITPEAPWTEAGGRFPRAEWMQWPTNPPETPTQAGA